MSTTRRLLPIITIQPTFQTVLSEVNSGIIPFDTFWVSCYKHSQPSVHANVHVQLDETHRDIVNLIPKADGDVKIYRQGASDTYAIACPTLNISNTTVLLPVQEYADPDRSNPRRPQRITAFDISPDGTQFSTGFHDGTVHIYPVSSNTPDRSTLVQTCSKPHLSSVTSLQFFPSSQVLLSAGADFSLAILPAKPLPLPSLADTSPSTTRVSPVRILRGHSRGITSTAIVSRGRNVLSGSTDGTVRLWDVGGGQQLRVIGAGNGKLTPVLSMSLGEQLGVREGGEGDHVLGTAPAADEREVDTADKAVFCGLNDGSFELLDLGSKRSVFQSKIVPGDRPASLSSITHSPSDNMLATGSIHGTVTVFDTRSLSTPLTSFYRNGAGIEGLVFSNETKASATQTDGEIGLVVATEDGLSYVAGVRPEGARVLAELAGVDCDGVRVVRVSGMGDIWTAADDGIVRKY